MDYNKLSADGWISPTGEFFSCEDYGSFSHEVSAEYLLLKFYNIESGICGDKLINFGWIKVTTSGMFYIYEEEGLYDNMTTEQLETFNAWKDKFVM